MEKIKLLLYCTKNGKKLVDTSKYDFDFPNQKMSYQTLNGKIVAECDFEVEEIEPTSRWNGWFGLIEYKTPTLSSDFLEKKSCIEKRELDHYLNRDYGYAIHIKNLNIFDKPRELSDYYIIQNENANPIDIEEDIKTVKKAPQNMMYCWDFIQEYRIFKKKIIISIRPEWLFKILNKEKTIEVRKKVLKEMITDA